MDIGFVARKLNLDGGGSNHSLHLMASLLSERGNDVTVITLESSNNTIDQDVPYEVDGNTDSWPPTQILKNKLVYDILSRSDHDIYHVFNPRILPGAGLFRRRTGTPVVGRLNTYKLFCTDPNKMETGCYLNCSTIDKFSHDLAKSWEKVLKIPLYASATHAEPRLANRIDRLFTISPAVRDIYVENGIDRSITRVVPNFYDPNFSECLNRRRDPGRRILTVGRLKPLKGIDVLIRAVENTEFQLDIVGDGGQRGELERLAEKTRADVTFHGWKSREEIKSYYRDCDIYVHPGRIPEPFGRTILEAMQYDLPLVVPDIGGPPWVAADAGIRFQNGNVESLRRCLQKLDSNAELYRQLSASCASRLEFFSPGQWIVEIESEYEKVIDK